MFIALLVWLWHWAVRHEAGVKQYWKRFLHAPRVNAMLNRFSPQLAFIRARFSPESYLGLRLTLGGIVLIGASWLFGGVAQDVVAGDPLTIIDARVAEWFHSHTAPLLSIWMLAVTHLHGVAAISIYVMLAALYLARKRDWYWLSCLLVTVPSGMALNALTKLAFHRARPSLADPIITLESYGFPSGHVAAATLLYGVLAAMLVAKMSEWRWRVLIVLSAIALVAVVAVTRMYLAVHYLSDAIAAFAEALAWLALCLTGIHTFWQHRTETG